jgi:poly(hydroxyalkanoate) depolymerase family esterase
MTFDSISETIDRALSSAGLDPRSGVMKTVTATIRRSLAAAGLPQSVVPRGRAYVPGDVIAEEPPAAGGFDTHLYKGEAGSRAYKLYVPSNRANQSLPLIVMLHGCKQNPDDFAAGTRMNELAEQRGFLVAYPAQSRNANGSNCWNWFQPGDQQRERGEPAILAGIVREISTLQKVDASRVYVAGLSAGASMAVILGATYPDLFKAVGAHSGLAHGAAHDVASAFGAMHGGGSGSAVDITASGIPTIVFQGDQDATVVAANADAIVRQALGGADVGDVVKHIGRPSTASHGYTTTVYADAKGRSHVEKWVVEDGQHAWFGGSDQGSYTDAKGPDASAEMVRFFLDR